MDKPLKIVIWILLGVIVVNLLFSFFSDSNLRAIRRDLQKANRPGFFNCQMMLVSNVPIAIGR
jgi:hypothetical protein